MKLENRVMHWCVMGWVSLFMGVVATVPISMARVSQTEKFAQQPFKSWDCQGQRTNDRAIITFETCVQTQAQPIQAHR